MAVFEPSRDGVELADGQAPVMQPPSDVDIAIRRANPNGLFRMLRGVPRAWPGFALFTILLGGWELLGTYAPGTELYFPDPARVTSDIIQNPGVYYNATNITAYESFVGFLIGFGIAIVFALLMSESRIADRALMPLFLLVKVTPSVAILPILIILMGFGVGPKIVIAAMTILYATLITVLTGFKSLDENVLEYMESLDASRWEIFWRLRIPNGLPQLFAAAKIGIPLAILGATFAEYLNSTVGLGNILSQASANIAMPRLWGAIYCLVAMGIVAVGLITVIEHRVLRWHVSQRL